MKRRSFASSGGDCHSRYTNNVFYHRLFPWILSFPEPFFYSFFYPKTLIFCHFPWPLCSSLPWYFLLSFLSSFFILTLILMPVSLPFPLVLRRPHLNLIFFLPSYRFFFSHFPTSLLHHFLLFSVYLLRSFAPTPPTELAFVWPSKFG